MLHYHQVKGLQQEKLRQFAASSSEDADAGDGTRENSATARKVEQGVDWLSEARRSIAEFLAGTGQETGEASSV